MIVVYLQGGLGNQMFQYAFGKALAAQTGRDLHFDISHFQNHNNPEETPRIFQLNQWQTECSFGSKEIFNLVKSYQQLSLFKRIFNKIIPLKNIIEITDASPLLLEKWDKYKIIYLRGYFQNEKYFSKISAQLRSQYIPQISVNPPFEKTENTVSVHVRRGDYISNAAAATHHGVTDLDFFKAAFSRVEERVTQPHYVIFSDDIEWCKTEFAFLPHKTFIEPRENARECEDLFWMSQCTHHIISNSSYSWWGAWLNSNLSKMVICPAKWIASQTTPKNDVVPTDWIQL